jgi:hypothetical protein
MRRAAVVWMLLVLLPACELPSENRPDVEDMVPGAVLQVPGREVVWVMVLRELERSGYQMADDRTIESTGAFETHWQTFLSPFRFEGRRVKILGRVEELEGGNGACQVLLTTWIQRNADLKDPMSPAGAIWQDIEPDMGTIETLLYRIETHFQQ